MLYRSVAVVAFASLAAAQTYTSCDPTKNSTCPSDIGLNQAEYSVDFTQGPSDDWPMVYQNVTYGSSGAQFTITKDGDAPTMQSAFYIFFGTISCVAQGSPGTGVISSFILESDDLDEIDWEWMGYNQEVETNYFGKGNTTVYNRATYISSATSQTAFHNYTIDWTPESIVWLIDGGVVRTLEYADALGGSNFPQTPMRIKLGSWLAEDTHQQGTISWAGGQTDFSQAPFNFYVKSISINNMMPGSAYTYSDETGSYKSITIDKSATSSSSFNTTSASSNSTIANPHVASNGTTASVATTVTASTSLGAATKLATTTTGATTASTTTASTASPTAATTTPNAAGSLSAPVVANVVLAALGFAALLL